MSYSSILIFLAGIVVSVAVNAEVAEVTNQAPNRVKVWLQSLAPKESPRENLKYLASANYAALEAPIPSKWGVSLGLIQSADKTLELEYMKGGFSIPGGFRDLAGINDVRIGLVRKSYYGNSFHLAYGISYFDFSAGLGDRLLNRLTQGAYPDLNVMTVQGAGVNVGIGNVWTFKKNITFGVDWLSWAQPLMVTKRSSDYFKYSSNQDDRKTVESTMKFVSYMPRLSLFSLRLGMLF